MELTNKMVTISKKSDVLEYTEKPPLFLTKKKFIARFVSIFFIVKKMRVGKNYWGLKLNKGSTVVSFGCCSIALFTSTFWLDIFGSWLESVPLTCIELASWLESVPLTCTELASWLDCELLA